MFVALDLPEPQRDALAAWRDELIAGRSDLRPVPAASLHVTLAFLGWQGEKEAQRIAAVAFGAVAKPAGASASPAGPSASLAGPSTSPAGASATPAGLAPPVLRAGAVRPLPPRGPRLFALDLEDEGGRCAAVQDAVSRALAEERIYRPEKRPFWPHVTLARVKRPRRGEGPRASGPLPDLPPPSHPMEAAELILYRSTLRPQGAVYDPLARHELS